jgi:hypothetical protein
MQISMIKWLVSLTLLCIASASSWGKEPADPYRVTTEKRAGYDWWALQPLRDPPIPRSSAQTQPTNPIDAFVREKLKQKELSASPMADRRTLIRRAYFDLIGLPPSPADVEAFLNDKSADAYERVIDRLLASPEYGVRWARHWLDIVRFGESNGFEHDEFRPSAWSYRDWVVDALNRDLPYDEFARLQLAGDVIRPNDPEAIKATGLLVAGAYDSVGQTQQSEAMRMVVRQDELEDVVGTVGQAFLGLTVQCARCHDHKFDPIHQVEYYRLTAALGGVRHGEILLPLPSEEAAKLRQELSGAEKELALLETPARNAIVAARKSRTSRAPAAFASWDFRTGLEDRTGHLHARLKGTAVLTPQGLKLDGKAAYAITSPLPKALTAKTLESWVKLDSLESRGGGVIGLETTGGAVFDSIVYAERDPAQWMAGSNFFVRSKSFAGPPEQEATQRFVHLTITYSEDGVITAYRNDRPYGQHYQSVALQPFDVGISQVIFGLRHEPVKKGALLAGVIARANLYDRALSASEVADSAGALDDYIGVDEISSALPAEARERYQRLHVQVEQSRAALARGAGKAYAIAPKEPGPTYLLARGNTKQPGEEVSAGGIAAIRGIDADFSMVKDAPEKGRRRKLSEWITSPSNPLFARVIVNRLWHYHFGTGIVETPSDFGFNGGRPSHPELLDFLAGELIRQHFSLKQMHKLIMTSQAYQQSSRYNEAAAKIDAGDRLLWRKAPVRLEAETLRDSVLAVAGKLNPRLGGPGFRDFKVETLPGKEMQAFHPVEVADADSLRRTLYRTWFRSGRNGLLDALDCPDPSATVPARQVTNTPLQALAMLNNALILQMSDEFAARLQRESPENVGRQIDQAYRLAFSRSPDTGEVASAREVVAKYGLNTLARALFNSSEFLFVD